MATHHFPARPRLLTAAAAVGSCLIAMPSVGRADVASARRPVAIFTPGPTLEYGLDGTWRFGGELTLSQYVGSYGYGGAFGGTTSGRLYGEAQAALILGNKHNLVVGLNPGFVVDVTADKPRWGGQATLWLNYAMTRRRTWPLASPIVPFARAQLVDTHGLTVTFGITLKLPIPAS